MLAVTRAPARPTCSASEVSEDPSLGLRRGGGGGSGGSGKAERRAGGSATAPKETRSKDVLQQAVQHEGRGLPCAQHLCTQQRCQTGARTSATRTVTWRSTPDEGSPLRSFCATDT